MKKAATVSLLVLLSLVILVVAAMPVLAGEPGAPYFVKGESFLRYDPGRDTWDWQLVAKDDEGDLLYISWQSNHPYLRGQTYGIGGAGVPKFSILARSGNTPAGEEECVSLTAIARDAAGHRSAPFTPLRACKSSIGEAVVMSVRVLTQPYHWLEWWSEDFKTKFHFGQANREGVWEFTDNNPATGRSERFIVGNGRYQLDLRVIRNETK